MVSIIDGNNIAQKIKETIKQEVIYMNKKSIYPCLAVIIIGNDNASRIYVNAKKKACDELGIISKEYSFDENISQEDLLLLINVLNEDSLVNGILVQLPLPKHIAQKEVIQAINCQKDVDSFNFFNVGKLMMGESELLPCTPSGCIELLKSTGVSLSGKHCVVIGRSNIVGKPMAMLLLQNDATVTICHSKTKNIKDICKQADIIVAAIGKPKFVTSDMIKNGAIVIDVGMNRLDNGKLCGDVDFDNVSKLCFAITPVPGGVGPMTIAMLMKNTVIATKIQNQKNT